MFMRARTRALSLGVEISARSPPRARCLFHAAGPSNQKRAICVWSSVRTVLILPPTYLHLVVVPRVGGAGQCRTGREARTAMADSKVNGLTLPQQERNRRRPVPARRVRIGDGRVGRVGIRMGPPLARTHARRIGHVADSAVIRAKRQHRGAGSAADGHTPGSSQGRTGTRAIEVA